MVAIGEQHLRLWAWGQGRRSTCSSAHSGCHRCGFGECHLRPWPRDDAAGVRGNSVWNPRWLVP